METALDTLQSPVTGMPSEPQAVPESELGPRQAAEGDSLTIAEDEQHLLLSLPTYDPKKLHEASKSPGGFDLFFSGLSSGMREYSEGISADAHYIVADLTPNKDIAKRLRDTRNALRMKMLEDSALPQEGEIGQEAVYGLGGAAGDIATMSQYTMIGAIIAVGAGVAAGPAIAMGAAAGMGAMWLRSFTSKWPELREKGVGVAQTALLSGGNATIAAKLEKMGFDAISNVAATKIAPVLQKSLAKLPGVLRAAGVAGYQGLIAGTKEGLTELGQFGVERYGVDYPTGTELDLGRDLKDGVMSYGLGLVAGGTIGASLSLASRRNMVNTLTKAGVPRKEASLYIDDLLMDTARVTMDAVDEVTGVDKGLVERIGKSFEKKIDKLQILEEEAFVSILGEQTPEQQVDKLAEQMPERPMIETRLEQQGEVGTRPQDFATALEKYVDEKGNFTLAGDVLNKELANKTDDELISALRWTRGQTAHVQRTAGANISGELRSRGVPVDEIKWQQDNMKSSEWQAAQEQQQPGTPDIVFQEPKGMTGLEAQAYRIRFLKKTLAALKTRQRLDMKEVRRVRRTLRSLLKSAGLAPDVIAKMNSRLDAIMTATDFENKGPVLRALINDAVSKSRVNIFRQYAGKLLVNLQTNKVSPDTRVFAEHLQNVLDGKVPEPMLSEDVARGTVEQLMFDLREADASEYSALVAVENLKNLLSGGIESYQSRVTARNEMRAKLKADAVENLGKIKGGRDITPKQGTIIDGEEVIEGEQKQVQTEAEHQADLNRGQSILPLSWWTTDWYVRDRMDRGQGKKVGTGFFVKELSLFDSDTAYQTFMGNFIRDYDAEFTRLYASAKEDIVHNHRSEIVGEIEYADGRAPEQLTKSNAMFLMMAAKDPYGRKILLENNMIDAAWLERFENGEAVPFSDADFQMMEFARKTLDSMYPDLKNTFEYLTDRPFPHQSQYWMMERFFDDSDAASDTLAKMILGDKATGQSITAYPQLIGRKGGSQPIKIKDFYTSFFRYVRDMSHFINYAGAIQKRGMLLGDEKVRNAIAAKMGLGYLDVLDEATDLIMNVDPLRNAEGRASNALQRLIGRIIQGTLATPQAAMRQASGILMGLNYGTPKELVGSFFSFPEAVKDGRAKAFMEMGALHFRWTMGDYDQAIAISNQLLRNQGTPKFYENKGFSDFITSFVRVGDRYASMRIGWMVFEKKVAEGMSEYDAARAALAAIKDTQSSMSIEDTPLIFYNKNLLVRGSSVFLRTPAQYVAKYVTPEIAAAVDALRKNPGRTTARQLGAKLAVMGLIIPFFDYLITFKDIPKDTDDWGYMASWAVREQTLVSDAVTFLLGKVAEAAGLGDFEKLTREPKNFYAGYYEMASQAVIGLVEAIKNPSWVDMDFIGGLGEISKEVVPPAALAVKLPGPLIVKYGTAFWYLSDYFRNGGDTRNLWIAGRMMLQQSEKGAIESTAPSSE